jgi:hypothetical protein
MLQMRFTTDYRACRQYGRLNNVSCAPQPKRVLNCLDETIPLAGETRLWNWHPCILFATLDLCEDWSGEFVNADINPFALLDSSMIGTRKFWARVRTTHEM